MRRILTTAAAGLGLLLFAAGIECATAGAEGIAPSSCGSATQNNYEKSCDGSTSTNPPDRQPSAGAQQLTPLPLQMMVSPPQRAGGARPSGPPAAALTPPAPRQANPAKPIVPAPGD
ncbi:hypothetical protein [Nocardia sp. NPDC049707]|uniref:hypothetical protein n=1 Tax=Nocardia sp. NPDC049707 TaxID=3154735 RepID=UPI003437C209